MSLAFAGEPRIVHAIPGRMRLHLPVWEGRGPRGLEARLRRVRGEQRAGQPANRQCLDPVRPDRDQRRGCPPGGPGTGTGRAGR